MPTYEYRCPEGHSFETFQRMSDEPVATCPECGKAAQRQISGGAGFLFKGDGFYITDYRSEDYKKKVSSEKGGAAEGSSGASSGSSSGEGSGSTPSGGSSSTGTSSSKSTSSGSGGSGGAASSGTD